MQFPGGELESVLCGELDQPLTEVLVLSDLPQKRGGGFLAQGALLYGYPSSIGKDVGSLQTIQSFWELLRRTSSTGVLDRAHRTCPSACVERTTGSA